MKAENKNVNSDYFGYISPEKIWAYGDHLKELKSKSELIKPYHILVTKNNIDKFAE